MPRHDGRPYELRPKLSNVVAVRAGLDVAAGTRPPPIVHRRGTDVLLRCRRHTVRVVQRPGHPGRRRRIAHLADVPKPPWPAAGGPGRGDDRSRPRGLVVGGDASHAQQARELPLVGGPAPGYEARRGHGLRQPAVLRQLPVRQASLPRAGDGRRGRACPHRRLPIGRVVSGAAPVHLEVRGREEDTSKVASFTINPRYVVEGEPDRTPIAPPGYVVVEMDPQTTAVLPVNRAASPLDPGASAAASDVWRRSQNVPLLAPFGKRRTIFVLRRRRVPEAPTRTQVSPVRRRSAGSRPEAALAGRRHRRSPPAGSEAVRVHLATRRTDVPLARTSRGGGQRLGVEGKEYRTLPRAGLAHRRPGNL